MLMKAVIVDREYENPIFKLNPTNKFKVRIPVLHGDGISPESTNDKYLPYATVCVLPNSDYVYQEGEIVFVDFENNDYGKPVIIGSLYNPKSKAISLPKLRVGNLDMSSLSKDGYDSQNSAILPKNTTIGDLSYKDLKRAVDLSNNLGGIINK